MTAQHVKSLSNKSIVNSAIAAEDLAESSKQQRHINVIEIHRKVDTIGGIIS